MNKFFRALINYFAGGFKIPGVKQNVRLVITLAEQNPTSILPLSTELEQLRVETCDANETLTLNVATEIMSNHIGTLLQKCPALAEFYHSSIEADPVDAKAFLTFCNDSAAIFAHEARQAHLRRQLKKLHTEVRQIEFRNHIERRIAASDLLSGVVERALVLKGDAVYGEEVDRQVSAFDEAYRAVPHYLAKSRQVLDLNGDIRGRTLTWYFAQKPSELDGKRVLHIAPEATLEHWMREQMQQRVFHYRTLDGFSTDVDFCANVTNLPFGESSFDIVICHRVLEHVPDDRGAMKEFRRILADGGYLSFSVPESPHLAETNEWLIQDSSHHDHVRQYGGDVVSRLEDSGFSVQIDERLLKKSLDSHLADRTYPLRHYLCHAITKTT